MYQPINRDTSSLFDVLRDVVPLDRIVEANGSRKAPCVAHNEDDIPDMHIYEDHAHCFVCGFHGDVVDVWGKRQGIMVPFEAALDLARELHIQVPEFSEEGRRKAEEKRQQEDDHLEQAKKFHAALEKNPIMREWWEGRGFDASLRERFLLGASSAGKASIPFWVPGGRVAGILHRKREGEPKYLLPAAEEFPDGHRPLFVPGPLGEEAFLLEGYVDGLAIAALGKSVVVVGGTKISAPQAEELRSLNLSRITILPDNDGGEGEEAARIWGGMFFPAAKIAPPDYGGDANKDIADLFASAGADKTTEHLDRLAAQARDLIDIETELWAEAGGAREKLAFATEHIVPLLARIHPAGMQDATADIVAARLGSGFKKSWLNNAIKDENDRLEGMAMGAMMREAQERAEQAQAEHTAQVEEAQPEIDDLFSLGVLERFREAAAKIHHVERDERELEMAILIATGAQLAPLPNGRPAGASSLLTAEAGRGKNHLADAAVELLPEEFYEAFEIVSAQAFYYAVEEDPDFLRHKFVYPNEIEGVEALTEFLRPMLQKGFCKKFVTDKDPATGRNTMRTLLVEGPVTTIIPTIRNKTDDQLQTRLLMAELEDYVGRVKIHSGSISRLYHPDHAQADFFKERFLWAEGLKQLTGVRRVVFRIEHEDFAYDDDGVSHGARLWTNLLGLMSAHAWLEQKNRRVLDVGGEQAIEATPDDYEAAYEIFTQVCKRTTVNLSETHRKILDGLDKLQQEEPGRDGFTLREIAKAGGIAHGTVGKHKTYLVSSAKLIDESFGRLTLVEGVTPAEWRGGDLTKGLPTPDKVREWWGAPPDGPEGGRGQDRGQRGQASDNGSDPHTNGKNPVHGHRGQSVDMSTPSTNGSAPHDEEGAVAGDVRSDEPLSWDLAPGETATLEELKKRRNGSAGEELKQEPEDESDMARDMAEHGGVCPGHYNRDGSRKTGAVVYAGKGGAGYDVYIGDRVSRGGHNLPQSPWYNPFKVDSNGKYRDGTIDQVLDKYEQYLHGGAVENYKGEVFDGRGMAERLPELRDKVLGCWCAGKRGASGRLTADEPHYCHGQILLRHLERGHVHGLSTEGVDSESGIGKPDEDTEETLSTVSTGSVDTGRRLTPDEVMRVRRLVHEGMSAKLARAEVLRKPLLDDEEEL